eukprot:6506712-Alexandrium_andersonii.AAC.1
MWQTICGRAQSHLDSRLLLERACSVSAPEKRLRRTRRPVSSSPPDEARAMTPNPADETC